MSLRDRLARLERLAPPDDQPRADWDLYLDVITKQRRAKAGTGPPLTEADVDAFCRSLCMTRERFEELAAGLKNK